MDSLIEYRGATVMSHEEEQRNEENLLFCKILDPKSLGSIVYDRNLNYVKRSNI